MSPLLGHMIQAGLALFLAGLAVRECLLRERADKEVERLRRILRLHQADAHDLQRELTSRIEFERECG